MREEMLPNRSKSEVRRIDLKVIALGKSVPDAEHLVHAALSGIAQFSRSMRICSFIERDDIHDLAPH